MSARDGTVRTAVVIGNFCPLPATHGNRRRLLSLFAWLRARGLRTVFVFQPSVYDDISFFGALDTVVDHCIVTERPRKGAMSRGVSSILAKTPALWRLNRIDWNRLNRVYGNLWSDRNVDHVCWPTTVAAVRAAVRRYNPVVVISAYPYFTRVFKGFPRRILKVIDTMEVFQRGAEERKQAGFVIEYSSASEARALKRADVLIGIQKNDAQALREIAPGKHVITAEHPSRTMLPRSAVPEPGVIMYVGSTNEYNRRGLSMFLEHAWRPILDAYPGAVLHVIGALTEDVMGSHERVEFKGIVSDSELAQSYASAHVVINPQVNGTGLKIKSVEAISAGCAVVMNAAGDDGIEEGSGTAFVVASDWKEFSQYVLRILADEDFRLGLEHGASRFAKERFSMETAFRELATVLDAHEARIGSI